MPTAAFHSFFWDGSADAGETPPDPPTSGAQVSYPTWQMTITPHVAGSGFGALQAVYERWLQMQVRDHGDHR